MILPFCHPSQSQDPTLQIGMLEQVRRQTDNFMLRVQSTHTHMLLLSLSHTHTCCSLSLSLTHTHTCTCTHTHTHMHTCTHTLLCSLLILKGLTNGGSRVQNLVWHISTFVFLKKHLTWHCPDCFFYRKGWESWFVQVHGLQKLTQQTWSWIFFSHFSHCQI